MVLVVVWPKYRCDEVMSLFALFVVLLLSLHRPRSQRWPPKLWSAASVGRPDPFRYGRLRIANAHPVVTVH